MEGGAGVGVRAVKGEVFSVPARHRKRKGVVQVQSAPHRRRGCSLRDREERSCWREAGRRWLRSVRSAPKLSVALP